MKLWINSFKRAKLFDWARVLPEIDLGFWHGNIIRKIPFFTILKISYFHDKNRTENFPFPVNSENAIFHHFGKQKISYFHEKECVFFLENEIELKAFIFQLTRKKNDPKIYTDWMPSLTGLLELNNKNKGAFRSKLPSIICILDVLASQGDENWIQEMIVFQQGFCSGLNPKSIKQIQ